MQIDRITFELRCRKKEATESYSESGVSNKCRIMFQTKTLKTVERESLSAFLGFFYADDFLLGNTKKGGAFWVIIATQM